MEILARGNPPSEPTYDATCEDCETVVRFKESEGVIDDSPDGVYISVVCPVCRKTISRRY